MLEAKGFPIYAWLTRRAIENCVPLEFLASLLVEQCEYTRAVPLYEADLALFPTPLGSLRGTACTPGASA